MEMQELSRSFIIASWVVCFSVPDNISSDRGPQFTSKLWNDMCELFGITKNYTTTYHPQANGLVERFHRHLKESLITGFNGPNWIGQLPWVMLGSHTAPKGNLNTSSAEMMYDAPFTVPGEFLPNMKSDPDVKRYITQLRDSVGRLRPVPMSTHDTARSSVPNDLHAASFVFV